MNRRGQFEFLFFESIVLFGMATLIAVGMFLLFLREPTTVDTTQFTVADTTTLHALLDSHISDTLLLRDFIAAQIAQVGPAAPTAYTAVRDAIGRVLQQTHPDRPWIFFITDRDRSTFKIQLSPDFSVVPTAAEETQNLDTFVYLPTEDPDLPIVRVSLVLRKANP